jgi:Fur family ferric uptake transcriptional regulator
MNASESAPASASQLAQRFDLRAELARRGIRLTRQRRILVETIQNASRHLDAETLWRQARGRDAGINLATVYRTLGMLKKLGLVDELDLMHLEGEKHYYEVSRATAHLHLACFGCGRIEEYQTEAFERLRQQVEQACGFSIRTGRLEFGGLCRQCRA